VKEDVADGAQDGDHIAQHTDSHSVFVRDEVVVGVEAAAKRPNGHADCQEDQHEGCLAPIRSEPWRNGSRYWCLLRLLAHLLALLFLDRDVLSHAGGVNGSG
jgi:hypothetical protein